jgi:hypothetical protein
MSDLPSIENLLTPWRHLTRVAAIPDRVVMRFRHVAESQPPRNLGDSRPPGLEVVSETRLSVSSRPEAGDLRL